MNLTALLCVRNEDWILGLSLRALLMFCDQAVVLLHSCTDRSLDIVQEIAAEHPGRIRTLFKDGDWDEMRHRQAMLEDARRAGATHIWLGDADEVLTGNLLPHIRKIVADSLGNILHLPLYNLRGGIDRYHANGVWANRVTSAAFRDRQSISWSGDTFHRREPSGIETSPYHPIRHGTGGILHLWGCSERRLIAKHRLYRITERLRWPNKSAAEIERYYSQATDGLGGLDHPSAWNFSQVPESCWEPYMELMLKLPATSLISDSSIALFPVGLSVYVEPWQEAECARLIAEHGIDKFRGLRVRHEDFK